MYRKANNEIEILVLVHHDGRYDIPKGTLQYGETLENCALREVEEESGQKGDVIGYLGGRLDEGVDKNNNAKISKITHYFAIKWLSDTGTHDHEYDRIEWMPAIEARDALNKPSSTEVINRFMHLQRSQESSNVPIN